MTPQRPDAAPLTLLVAALAAVCCLASTTGAGEPVSVEAEAISYEQEGAVLKADGGVKVRWNGNSLSAESVRFEREQGRLVATGGLRFDNPEILVEAESCDLFVETEAGELNDVRVSLKNRSGSFGGKTIRKYVGQRYELEDGYYTTCMTSEDEAPDWDLAAKEIDLELEDYGKIEGGTLRVRGFPVLYIPYAVFPARMERRSGLLFPRFGLSDERGFIYSQPFFWNIDKHRDLTITGEVETNERVGIGVEHRYRPSRQVEGGVELRYYNEDIRDSATDVISPDFDKDVPDDRAVLRGLHRQELTPGLRFYADALIVSDELFLREIDSVDSGFFLRAAGRTRRYTDSRIGLLGQHGSTSYGFKAAGYQDFIGPDRLTVQKPFEFWAVGDGSLASLGYTIEGTVAAFNRVQRADGLRMDLTTTLERPLLVSGPVRANAWVRGRFTGYRMWERTQPEALDDEELDRLAARGVLEAGAEVRTGFSRTYRMGDGYVPASEPAPVAAVPAGASPVASPTRRRRFTALEHTVEPFAAFRYTGNSDEDDLPLFDTIDRIDGRRVATYGVASRFLFTEAEGGQTDELARVSFAQSYKLDERVLEDHFSDIDATMALNPVSGVSISGLASYNVSTNALQGAAAAFSFSDFSLPMVESDGSRLDGVYRFVRRGAVATAEEGLETIEARAILALSETVSIGFNGRYDFVSESTVERGGGLRIRSKCDCWSMDIGVIDRVNPDELQFRLQIELIGLAGFGGSALRFETPGLSVFDRGLADALRYGW